jgi:hypothetical protein
LGNNLAVILLGSPGEVDRVPRSGLELLILAAAMILAFGIPLRSGLSIAKSTLIM